MFRNARATAHTRSAKLRARSWCLLSPRRPVGENATDCCARKKNDRKEHEYPEVGENATNHHAREKNDGNEHEYPRECAAKGTKSIGYQHGPIPGLPRLR